MAGTAGPSPTQPPPTIEELRFAADQAKARREALTEQVKLAANCLNIMAAGTYVTGVLAPLVQSALSDKPFENMSSAAIVLMAILSVVAFIIHSVGALWLERLK